MITAYDTFRSGGAALAVAFLAALPARATNTISIDKSSAGLLQTCAGFGATAGHPAYDLSTSANATFQGKILDFLYGTSTNGDNLSDLGLTIVRLAINPYAPNDPNYSASQETIEPTDGGAWFPSFPNGAQNDAGQIWFAQEAEQRGVSRFFALPWSPPSWMKSNGGAQGGTMLSSYLGKFASYLETYELHYDNSLTDETGGTNARPGVPIQWMSLQNEPDTTGVNWATCNYVSGTTASGADPLGLNNLIDGVCPQLEADNMPALLLAPEGGNCSSTTGSLWYLNGMTSTERGHFPIVSSHNYGTNTYDSHIFDQPNKTSPKPVWMTEHCHGTVAEPSTTAGQVTDAISWAQEINTWLENPTGDAVDGACAYCFWFAANSDYGSPKVDSLVHFDTSSQVYSTPLRAFAMGQYSRFIRPGYQRVTSSSSDSSLLCTAWVNPVVVNNVQKSVIVVVNINTTTAQTATVSFSGNDGLAASVNVYETRELSDQSLHQLYNLSPVTISSRQFSYTFPANSVTTFIESAQLPTAAPAAVSNLAGIAFDLGSRNLGEPGRFVQLTWKAPGASGTVGMANKIDIRYSKTPGFGFNDTTGVTKLAALLPGLQANTTQSVVISGLTGGTDYYFLLEATSPTGATSLVSNQAHVKTKP